MYSQSGPAVSAKRENTRRSLLFVPASNARAIEKARASEADCVVLDLEDMVPADDKPAGREQLAALLAAGDWTGPEPIVRVNGLDTPWGADDIAAVASRARALLLPKIEGIADLEQAIGLIDEAGGQAADIWILAETPRAILDIDAIVGASPRVKAIVMGTQDLIKAIGIRPDPGRTGLLHLLSQCVLAARAHGKTIVDGVYLGVKDEDGFAAVCAQGLALGFDGKALIHPNQIATANRLFGPDA